MKSLNSSFSFARFSQRIAQAAGSPATFFGAVIVIASWAITGPIFGYSDTWQLIINTGTTIITFLMVFLIQNTQNRDSEALQLKIDELIRAVSGAHNSLLNLEELEQAELDRIRKHYLRLADQARQEIRSGRSLFDEEKNTLTKNVNNPSMAPLNTNLSQ
jgi:low affinity Fe/Cu permease